MTLLVAVSLIRLIENNIYRTGVTEEGVWLVVTAGCQPRDYTKRDDTTLLVG